MTKYNRCHGFTGADDLDYDKGGGLIPAVVQDCQSGQVLMVAFMNREAVAKTISTHLATFFSRERGKLWTKGEESGNFMHVRALISDCDNDTVLVLVRPDGPACHKGTVSCFDKAPLPDATARYLAGVARPEDRG